MRLETSQSIARGLVRSVGMLTAVTGTIGLAYHAIIYCCRLDDAVLAQRALWGMFAALSIPSLIIDVVSLVAGARLYILKMSAARIVYGVFGAELVSCPKNNLHI